MDTKTSAGEPSMTTCGTCLMLTATDACCTLTGTTRKRSSAACNQWTDGKAVACQSCGRAIHAGVVPHLCDQCHDDALHATGGVHEAANRRETLRTVQEERRAR